MTRNHPIHPAAALAGMLALIATPALLCAAGKPAEKPNIVVIMADDLGWRDLHCYGNAALDTPALNRFAAEGMRFTNGYAASPVCTPTRAAMMTGQSPARLRITNHAPGNPVGFALKGSPLLEAENLRYLPLAATTIAERLSAAGYATAHVGKWHLSYRDPGEKDPSETDLRPDRQGFDINMGGTSGGGPPSYFSPYRIPTLPDGKDGEYLPERLADEAIGFIRQHRDVPFYLNWWLFSVHYPMQAREEVIAKYRLRGGIKDPPNYAFHKQNRLASAIREGKYKLIRNYDDHSLELYDLDRDLGEKDNLAATFPDLAKRLAEKLDTWLRQSDARLPLRKPQE